MNTDFLQMFSEGAAESADGAEATADTTARDAAAQQETHEESEQTEGCVLHTADENNSISPAFIKALEGRMKKIAAENMKTSLMQDAAALRSLYPSFDLRSELSSSPGMKELLISGVGLRRAYEVTHFEEIVGSAMRYAAMMASRETAEGLMQSPRVAENSLSQSAASMHRRSVESLTDKDIRAILTDVQNGKKVTF